MDNDITKSIEEIVKETTIPESPTKKMMYVVGEVNENATSEALRELIETDWESGITELNLYIVSEGGFLRDCFAIIELMQEVREKYGVTIKTYGLGEVASAGFFLFILGDERRLYPSCRVFVHEHITINDEKTYGERIKADKTEEKEVYENYVRYTAERLDISIRKAKNLLKKNKWLTKKEIRDYNINKG